ncbi:vWA domain-containing protein [Phaeacidiphilus oryzae]|uniref:vWA domain-containing protein n=1 Tax=Phaeacidiphilus oryzae TaxID=348818 RepID=UPI000B1EEE4D|nr:VWA domain-containing protein [Phaeacidiphilus oryzae]
MTEPGNGTLDDPLRGPLGLVRALRAAGVEAGQERAGAFLRALDRLDATRRPDVYWAGRLTLCADPDQLVRYDRVFEAYFSDRDGVPRERRPPRRRPSPTLAAVAEPPRRPDRPEPEPEQPPATALASAAETLRHRDVSALTAEERRQLALLLAEFTLPGESRSTARRQPSRRGAVDPRRTVRELLRHGGEPARLRRRARSTIPRRVVLLLDISGSMAPYADALLRFAHAAGRGRGGAGGRTEVFTLGTRLTRITRELAHRDPDFALRAVGEAAPDWSGGTRLGETLRQFLDQWGRRGTARGAVVVLLSDGWERGDPELLEEQMRRLHRLAHRVVWANPRKARPGYAPLAAGMAAALRSGGVDAFVEGHSLAALERLAAVVRGVRDD